jgi:hypothetical protein
MLSRATGTWERGGEKKMANLQADNTKPDLRLNLLLGLSASGLTCAVLLPQLHHSDKHPVTSTYTIFLFLVCLLIPVSLVGVTSKSARLKSATHSAIFGLLVGMVVALAWSAFVWKWDKPESVLIVALFALREGFALWRSCRK